VSKSSPARQKYHAENYARRNASRLAAQAMHRAAQEVRRAEHIAELIRQTEKDHDQ